MKIYFLPFLFSFFYLQSTAQCPDYQIGVSGPTTFCAGGSVTLTGPVGISSPMWYNNTTGQFITTANNLTVTQTGLYYFIIPNAPCGVMFSNYIGVLVYSIPQPHISISGNTYICSGDSTKLHASTINGTYQWKYNGVNISGATSLDYYAKSTGTFACEETNMCGVGISNSVSVYVNQPPPAIISTSGLITFCKGNAINSKLYADSISGANYQWKRNGTAIPGENNLSFNTNITGYYTCIISNCMGSFVSNNIVVREDTTCTSTLYFDGNDMITIPALNIYNVGTGGFTLQAIIRDDADPNVTSSEPIFSNWSTANPLGFRFGIYNGYLQGFHGINLKDGNCHVVSMAYVSSNGTWLYAVDGVGQSSASGTPINSTLPITIGAGYNTLGAIEYFKGTIREVRLWKSASHYTDMNNVLDTIGNPDLIGYWRLNEGTVQQITDYSIYKNNGVSGIDSTVEIQDPQWSTGCPSCTLPNVSITASSATSFCYGDSVQLNASPTGAGYSYQWRVNGKIIHNATDSSYITGTPGDYDVLVKNFCSSYSNVMQVNVMGSISSVQMQPDALKGGDATINENFPLTNFGNVPDLKIDSWNTFYDYSERGLIRFELKSLPQSSLIQHAELILYNSPTASITDPFSNFSASTHYHTASWSNAALLQRITSYWNESTVTWNTQPSITTINQVTLPANTSPHQDYIIDVTQMVRDMVADSSNNFGFKIKLLYETYFRALLFASSDYPDSTKWPRLTIYYYDSTASNAITAAGPTTICSGDTVRLSTTSTAGTSYQWQRNGTIIPGATSSIYNATINGYYDCIINTTCRTSISNNILVKYQTLPSIADSISAIGSPTICSGDSVTLMSNTLAGVNYQWLLNNDTIPGATSSKYYALKTGNYSCLISNSCGAIISNTIAITIMFVTKSPRNITGPVLLCPGTNGIPYSVPVLSGALIYQWIVPMGVTITSGSGSNNIVVSVSNNFSGGSLSVAGINNCGAGLTRTKIIYNGISKTPATISGMQFGLCNLTTNYTINPVVNATTYQWTVPSAATIISGQGTTSVTVTYSNSLYSGFVRVKSGSSCGFSRTRSIAVKGSPETPSIINGPTTVCDSAQGVAYSTSAVANTTTYNWTVPSG
ncbi:MAG: DNRLRE domain-containing protein, partial [Bacteroidota bacterium]